MKRRKWRLGDKKMEEARVNKCMEREEAIDAEQNEKRAVGNEIEGSGS